VLSFFKIMSVGWRYGYKNIQRRPSAVFLHFFARVSKARKERKGKTSTKKVKAQSAREIKRECMLSLPLAAQHWKTIPRAQSCSATLSW
jgi:hypothetical protein